MAVAICRSGDRVLVERGYDRARDHHHYRAIGGGVEFGERAAAAVAREWREEFDFILERLTLLGVLENLFTYEARARHEIIFVFAAHLSDPRATEREEFKTVDSDGAEHIAVWVPLGALRAGSTPLYPVGTVELLTGAG